MTFDREGRLTVAGWTSRCMWRMEHDGSIVQLATHLKGIRIGTPNDIVVKSDGSIYFTDPDYGVRPEEKALDFNGVFRIKPDGKIELLVKDFDKPNGLCFSADESKLYIADSPKRHIRVFKAAKDGTLSGGEVFAKLSNKECPDGMKIGPEGNLYSSGPGGIWVFDPTGKHLETIPLPETPSNLAWGDKDGKTLYITARTGVYKARRN